MALIELPGSRMSGSVGSTTYSHNRGGPYVRTRATPTNPNSTFQQAVRSAVSQLSARWTNVLTAAQRTAWETYAGQVSVLNRLGNPIFLTGLAHYVRSNVPIVQMLGAGSIVDDGPTTYNLGDYTAPVITPATSTTISVAYNDNDDWVSEDDAHMLVYASRSVGRGINYFKGPYRHCGTTYQGAPTTIPGNSLTPPASPQTLYLPFLAPEGGRTFYFARVLRADGRLSASWRGYGDCSYI